MPTKGDITPGSDNNLWFTQYKDNDIGQITTSGTVTEFASGVTHPYAIAPGSDHNLWYTEYGGNEITRMTTAGTVTGGFLIPTANSKSIGITPGPDGNLWFTEFRGNNVANISTSGSVTEFPLPAAHRQPWGITPGSNGNMWFAENGGDDIATISLPNLNLINIYYIPNRFFIPNITRLRQQGETVSWLILNPGLHGIADASGMGLFETPNGVRIGGTFSFTFSAAGSYVYDDPFARADRGSVRVPITVRKAVGAVNTAQVTWASADPPSGFAFDVEVEQPGSTSFIPWMTRVTSPTAAFGPSDPLWAGAGTYRFRARMENTANGKASGFSTPKSITLS